MHRSINRFAPARLMFITDDADGGGGPVDREQGGAADQPGDDAEDGDESVDDKGDESADELGDAGKQALARMKARVKAANARALAAERERDEAKGLTEKEKVQREADAAALTKANQRIVRSEIKTAAKGVLADPTDAFRYLDVADFEVDNDGNVDEDEIAGAIADLVKSKPYLAAAQGQQQRFQGGADQGARKASQKSEEQQLTDALGEATKARDFERAIQIRQRLAAIKAAQR